MKTLLNTWKGSVQYNGNEYDSVNQVVFDGTEKDKPFSIVLLPKKVKPQNAANNHVTEAENKEVVITVKQYMTKKASPEFDFMAKWNNDNPMPLRTMVGVRVKETPGMVYMKLHGDILQEVTPRCMKCGKALTNKVSQYFGIGPECGGHNYVNPFDTEEELKQAVSEYKKKLQDVTWEGWIIKSAITKEEER